MKLNNYNLATMTVKELLKALDTSLKGLPLDEIQRRQEEFGRNVIEYKKEKSVFQIILEAFLSPFSLVLIALAIISYATEYLLVAPDKKDATSAVIIITLVLISAALEIVQKISQALNY